jgi:hypothetical protein
MTRSVICHALVTLLLATSCAMTTHAQPAGPRVRYAESEGREFWIAFPKNFQDRQVEYNEKEKRNDTVATPPVRMEIAITARERGEGIVEIPALGFRRTFVVEPGEVVTVPIDSSAQINSIEAIENRGVHVVASTPITVTALSTAYQTSDTYRALPVDALGREYRAIGYSWLARELLSQFVVVAVEDDTEVMIVPSVRTFQGDLAGRPFTIRLDRGEVYQVIPWLDEARAYRERSVNQRPADLTGTLVTSTRPVALFSGHRCAYVPDHYTQACNFLVEQIPPTSAWGRNHLVAPLADRPGSVYRVLPLVDRTILLVDDSLVATLAAGEFYQGRMGGAGVHLRSSDPVLVAQYATGGKGHQYDSGSALAIRYPGKSRTVGDPTMLLVSPVETYLREYRISTPMRGEWHHFINVIAPATALADLRLDDLPVDPALFHHIGLTGWMYAEIEIADGFHTIVANEPIGVYQYGFGYGPNQFDAYGNSAGGRIPLFE